MCFDYNFSKHGHQYNLLFLLQKTMGFKKIQFGERYYSDHNHAACIVTGRMVCCFAWMSDYVAAAKLTGGLMGGLTLRAGSALSHPAAAIFKACACCNKAGTWAAVIVLSAN